MTETTKKTSYASFLNYLEKENKQNPIEKMPINNEQKLYLYENAKVCLKDTRILSQIFSDVFIKRHKNHYKIAAFLNLFNKLERESIYNFMNKKDAFFTESNINITPNLSYKELEDLVFLIQRKFYEKTEFA